MKPLRPFQFPLNIGNDICQISRVYRILVGPRATNFVNRILAPEELTIKDDRLNVVFDPTKAQSDTSRTVLGNISKKPGKFAQLHEELAANDSLMWKCATFMAGRFAVKEAVIKAHPYRKLTFHDVIIERVPVDGERLGSGPPIARVRAGEGDSMDKSAMVSISHDGDYATAVCLGFNGTGTGTGEEGKKGKKGKQNVDEGVES